MYPARTDIIIPSQHAEEILKKLKQHQGITSVDGELTVRGVEINNELENEVHDVKLKW